MTFNNVAKWITWGSIGALVAVVAVQNTLSSETHNPDIVTLSETNTVTLTEEVTGDSVGQVISHLKEINTPGNKKPVYLFLNTPGGSIQSGLELIEAVKGLDRPTHTITLFAASMGFQIAQNLQDRLILKNGVLMSHRAKGEFAGEFGGTNPSQVDSRHNLWKARVQEMDEQTVSRTHGKQTLASYQAQYSPELWMTGTQSVERGYADRVVAVKCDKTLSGTTPHHTNFMGMDIGYDLDKCPINTAPMNVHMNIATNQGRMDSQEFIRKNGSFDSICLVSNVINKLCSLDTSMNASKLEEAKARFISTYSDKQRQALPFTW